MRSNFSKLAFVFGSQTGRAILSADGRTLILLAGHRANAGVVSIDLTGYLGPNAGLAFCDSTSINSFTPGSESRLDIENGTDCGFFGRLYGLSLQGFPGGIAAATGDAGNAVPIKFGAGALIDATAGGGAFQDSSFPTVFGRPFGAVSPAFGPNSFLGFRDTLGRFGYIEVTWNGIDTFELFSAAYESTPGVAIQTPSAGAVPEPTSMAIFGLGALGMAYRARRKAKAKATQA